MRFYIKAVGAGVKRARALTRDEARAAMRLVAAGEVEPVQIGAFLLALRMKGETAEELAGFAEALGAFVTPSEGAFPDGLLEVDAHGDGHAGVPSLLAAAACAAAVLGVPTCLSLEVGSPFARHGLDGALAVVGLSGALTPARARRDLARAGVAACDLGLACPPLARLVALRPLLGVRTVAQTAAKLVSSLSPEPAPRRLVGVFHAPYLEPTARAIGLLCVERGLVVQALGGLPEARPGKIVRAAWADSPTAHSVDLRAFSAAADDLSLPVSSAPSPPVADQAAAAANRAALDGESPHAERAAAAAGLLLMAATGADAVEGARRALLVLRDGRARAVVDRLG